MGKEDFNAKIMAITMLIQEKAPELYKFLNEMPITIPNVTHPKINIKILQEYHESLENMLKNLVDHETY